jgi:methylthioribose-1-phosphate isomerase
MLEEPSSSPLRKNGIYAYQGLRLTAVMLSSDGRPWESTALVHIAPGSLMPKRLLYLRHADNALLDGILFAKIGTIDDLVDTGEDADVD